MKGLVVLGSGTGVPSRDRSAPGLALEVEDEEGRAGVVLVDPGAGSIHRMARFGLPLERLRWVVVTHFHPDHVGDLAPLLFALKNPRFAGRSLPVLVGPPGLREHRRRLESAHGEAVRHGARLEVVEFPGSSPQPEGFVKVGPLELTAYRTEHTSTSVALRFESRRGKVLSYTGDTDYCQGAVDAARDADLLVAECSFPEGRKVPGHLVPSEVGRLAAAAGAGRVLMTHFYPECEGEDLVTPCRRHFDGEVLLAEDGLTVRI